jgi:hypothetical protein
MQTWKSHVTAEEDWGDLEQPVTSQSTSSTASLQKTNIQTLQTLEC